MAYASNTPVVQWDVAHAASCVQGSTVIVRANNLQPSSFDDDGDENPVATRAAFVVVSDNNNHNDNDNHHHHLPANSGWSHVLDTERGHVEARNSPSTTIQNNRRMMMTRCQLVSSPRHNNKWTMISRSSTVMAWSGLAVDIHLLQARLYEVEQAHTAVQGDTIMTSNTNSVLPHLTRWIRTEAAYASGRPLGVQVVVWEFASDVAATQPMLYTINPAGNLIAWRSGCTALGADAARLRQRLHGILMATTKKHHHDNNKNNENSNNDTASGRNLHEATVCAVRALVLLDHVDDDEDTLLQTALRDGRVDVCVVLPPTDDDGTAQVWRLDPTQVAEWCQPKQQPDTVTSSL